MRGFLVGSLILIAGYALLQQGSADKVSAGGNALVGLARRFLSPGVAGVPDRSGSGSGTGSNSSAPPGTQGQSGLGKAGQAGGGGGGGGGGSF